MKLICKVVGIRPYDNGLKAVDLVWRDEDGAALRDDGATEITDQIHLAMNAGDDKIKAKIEKQREALYKALAAPGLTSIEWTAPVASMRIRSMPSPAALPMK